MTITAAPGGGNWSAGGSWVGGVAPGASDDVLLTATSGNITIDGTTGSPNLCRSLTCTGYVGTLTHATTKTLNIGDGTAGALLFAAGMTYVPVATSVINFVSTTTGNNITFAGKAMCSYTFNGVGGGWQFQDAPATLAANSITLTSGALDLNGKTFSVGTFLRSGTATASLTMGNGTITAATWDATSSSGFTLTPNSSTITGNSSGFIFHGGNLTYNNLTITNSNQTTVTIDGNNTFATLNVGTGNGAALVIGGDQTCTTFQMNGGTAAQRQGIFSDVPGTRRTITAGTVTVAFFDARDLIGAGAGNWNISGVSGGSGDCGNNSGITFTTPKNCFFKAAASANFTAANWFTTTGGSTPVSPTSPLPQDTAFFDANSFTAGSIVITLNSLRHCKIDMTGSTNAPTLSTSFGNANFYGDLILATGVLFSSTNGFTFGNTGVNQGFTTAGLTITNPITVNNGSSTLTINDNLSSSSTLTCKTGTTTSAAAKTTSFTSLTVNGGTLTLTGNMTLTGTTTASSGTINGGGFSIAGGTTGAFSGATISNLSWSGTIPTISAGTCGFNTLTSSSSSTFSGGTATATTHTATSLVTVSGGTYSPGALTVSSAGLTCSSGTFSPSGTTTLSGGLTVSGTGICTATGLTINATSATHSSSGACSIGTLVCSSTFSQTGTGQYTAGSGGVKATTATFSGASTRTIDMGTGTWEVTSTGTVWDYSGSNVTFTGNASRILMSNTSSSAKTMNFGSATYFNLKINGAASNGITTFTGSPTFNNMTFDPDSSIKFTSSTTTTAAGILWSGTSGHLVTVAAVTAATFATISCANAVSIDFVSLKDSHASGQVPFYAGANSTNVSGNANWTFTAPPPPITSTSAVTEANDSVVSSGLETFTGTLAQTEQNDSVVSSGLETMTGTLAKTEQNDSVVGTGQAGIRGAVANTEQNDSVVSSGLETFTGSSSVTEANDSVVSSGLAGIRGTSAVTEANDSISASGLETITSSLAQTEQSDSVVGTGLAGIRGSLAITEQSDSIVASGLETLTGSSSITEGNDLSSSFGLAGIRGAGTVTEQNDSVVASGLQIFIGSLSVTEQSDSSVGSGIEKILGIAALTEQNDSMAASGLEIIKGTAAITEQNDSMAASGLQTFTGRASIREGNDSVSALGAAFLKAVRTSRLTVILDNKRLETRLDKKYLIATLDVG